MLTVDFVYHEPTDTTAVYKNYELVYQDNGDFDRAIDVINALGINCGVFRAIYDDENWEEAEDFEFPERFCNVKIERD